MYMSKGGRESGSTGLRCRMQWGRLLTGLLINGAVIAPCQYPAYELFEVHRGAQAGIDIWARAD